jgi:Tfp pilus assembly protein PilO
MADLLNDGLQTSWSILAAAGLESLAAEVVAAAEEVDAMIRSLPATTPLAQILAEVPALLDRSLHRVEHLEQIDRALGRQ